MYINGGVEGREGPQGSGTQDWGMVLMLSASG